MASTNGFLGFDNFVWFQGVVEDRMDPLKLGRIRVRILGIHTELKNKIPTNELPWAYPVMPITSASMNGIGDTPIGPVEGTWVVGFFRDGENCQEPVVFGTIGGIPQERGNSRIGFSDPFNKYPQEEYIKEPDTNRLARNEKIEKTIVQQKKDKAIKEPIPVALEKVSENGGPREEGDDTSWVEPDPIYDAKYPFNKVFQTQSGHIKEWDDTKDKTRIHEYHQLGTFYEVYEVEDGGEKKANKLTKINGDNFTIVVGNDNIYVQGSCNITVDGRVNVYSVGDVNVEADNNANVIVKGDTTLYCHKNISINAEKDINIDAGGDLNITADNIRMTPTKNFTLTALNGNVTLAAKDKMGFQSLKTMTITSEQDSIRMMSLISTEIGSENELTMNSKLTSVNSTIKTSLGSFLSTEIVTGGSLELESKNQRINAKSLLAINLESPKVTRRFPRTSPVGPIIFNPFEVDPDIPTP
jgi:hypothetical protein